MIIYACIHITIKTVIGMISNKMVISSFFVFYSNSIWHVHGSSDSFAVRTFQMQTDAHKNVLDCVSWRYNKKFLLSVRALKKGIFFYENKKKRGIIKDLEVGWVNETQ